MSSSSRALLSSSPAFEGYFSPLQGKFSLNQIFGDNSFFFFPNAVLREIEVSTEAVASVFCVSLFFLFFMIAVKSFISLEAYYVHDF